MKVLERFWKTVVIVFSAILLLTAAPTGATASAATLTVIMPDEAQAQTGKTYGEWSVAWWQYALETPADNNPLLDPTGANCNFGQSGAVFFLVSTNGGTATRNECRVPAGKILFLPLLVTARYKETTDPQPEAGMRAAIQGFVKSTRNLQANFDGEDVSISLDPDTTLLRTRSPANFFTINAPANNIFGGVPGQSYDAVSDGFYLMLAPLAPGAHTITFGGASRNFSSYVTYNLYVEP